MRDNDRWLQVQMFCPNCGQKLIGFRNANGLVKIQCPRCGIVVVGRRMSRRHKRLDVMASGDVY